MNIDWSEYTSGMSDWTCSKCLYWKHKLSKVLLRGTGDYGLKSHIFSAVNRNFWIDSNRNQTWTSLSKNENLFIGYKGPS